MNKEDIRKMNTASCSICLISRANCAKCPFNIYYTQAHPLQGIGVQEPPQDYRIFNRRHTDGTFPPLSEFFENAIHKADS